MSSLHAAFYAAFGSPSLGITWSIVTFLSALLYLVYDKHNRRMIEAGPIKNLAPDETHRASPEATARST